MQQRRIVTADPIDDLGDLIKRKVHVSARVPDAAQICPAAELLDHAIHANDVRRRPDFVEVQRSRQVLCEPMLNPVDRSSVPIEADSHRQ